MNSNKNVNTSKLDKVYYSFFYKIFQKILKKNLFATQNFVDQSHQSIFYLGTRKRLPCSPERNSVSIRICLREVIKY